MVKNLPANAGDTRDMGSIPGLVRSPWRRKWQPTPDAEVCIEWSENDKKASGSLSGGR